MSQGVHITTNIYNVGYSESYDKLVQANVNSEITTLKWNLENSPKQITSKMLLVTCPQEANTAL